MGHEIERFLELYGALARVTHDWITAAPDDVLEWVPVDGPESLFIDGRGRMSILGQYIHIIVGDHVQAPQLATCADGARLNAFDKDIAERLRASPDLIDDARAMHEEARLSRRAPMAARRLSLEPLFPPRLSRRKHGYLFARRRRQPAGLLSEDTGRLGPAGT